MEPRILRLNSTGQPIEWLHWKQAACLYSRDLVCWSMGGVVRTVYGGHSRFSGMQSFMELPAIIACNGKRVNRSHVVPPLTNRALFSRDNYQCMYCGNHFRLEELSRDHIVPVSRGGADSWTNVVAACKRCNQRKSNHLLSEISMELLALPFRPNTAEYLALTNSDRIRGDQMEFLSAQFSKNSRIRISS
ncbi:HNH endonuclease [Sessilibacter sp. MAH2]